MTLRMTCCAGCQNTIQGGKNKGAHVAIRDVDRTVAELSATGLKAVSNGQQKGEMAGTWTHK